MKKTVLLVLGLLPLCFGCISTVSYLPSSIMTPVSILATPSGFITPTPFFPTPSVPDPSFSPSVNITPIPTPPNYPSPTHTPDPLEGYELYSKTVGCLPVDPNLKPKLDYPVDLAVTKNGKKVYVINSRKEGNVSYYSKEKTYKSLVNRQYIYEIKDDKTISILKVDGEYPFSCHLSEEIEMDNNENLYISKPIVGFKLPVTDYIGYEIYKIYPDKNMSLHNKITLNTPDPSPSARPDLRHLTNLHLDYEGSIYYMLRTGDQTGTNPDQLRKLPKDRLSNEIKIFSASIKDFIIRNDKAYLYNINFSANYIEGSGSLFHQNDNYDMSAYKDFYIEGDSKIAMDKEGNIYATDISKHNIWKITTDKKIIKFAGNGQAGYKNGKGEEAQFNNPTTMTFDGNGNMFVADSGNNAIRKITPDGTVSTFYKENN